MNRIMKKILPVHENPLLEKKTGLSVHHFLQTSSNTFEPNLRIATPRNYILGPEDELVVDIYGNSVDNFKMKISPEGTVKMLNLAPVYVNGLTIEQATERIVNRLRQAYSTLKPAGFGNIFITYIRKRAKYQGPDYR